MATVTQTVGVIALLAVFAALPAVAANPCRLQQFGELDVTDDHGALTVPAVVNGHPIRLFLDTGSTATLLFRGSAEDLGLKWSSNGEDTVYGVGGSTPLGMARIKQFEIAGITIHDFNLMVAGRLSVPEAQGLIGAAFLLQADMEFDVRGKKVRFFKPKDCVAEQVVYWGGSYSVAPLVTSASEKKIDVRVAVNGKPVLAEMDSGAGTSTLTANAARRVGSALSTVGQGQISSTRGVAGESLRTQTKVFSTFSFGDETIKNARIEIADMFTADEEVHIGSMVPKAVADFPEMLLGADFFRSHRIYVAMSQKKVYVSYVGGPVFQTHEASNTSPTDK